MKEIKVLIVCFCYVFVMISVTLISQDASEWYEVAASISTISILVIAGPMLAFKIKDGVFNDKK